jgi:hypothetical protein
VAELKAAESSAIDQAVRRLAQIAGGAIDVLNTIMLDTNNPPAPRVTAATNALSQLLKLRELHDLETRVAALEQVTNESKSKRR